MKNHGFSLVEAIVVAVIMAVLAAVGIPMYAGYVKDQKISTVTNLAETAAAAANAYWRRTNVDPTVEQLNLYFDAAKYDVLIDGTANTVTVQEKANTDISATKNY